MNKSYIKSIQDKNGCFIKKYKAAFTLAEVLITLSIIGIVAALTLPSLIAKHQEKVWLNRFKQTYSILSQAYLLAYNDHGISSEWGLYEDNNEASVNKMYSILSKYLKVSKDVGKNCQQIFTGTDTLKQLDGTIRTSVSVANNSNNYCFVLANGTSVSLNYISPLAAESYNVGAFVDINGRKKPNTLGKDMFFLYLTSVDNKPSVTGYDLWWVNEELCSVTKSNPISGWYKGGACATWIIKNGNMDYLHREISHEEWIK